MGEAEGWREGVSCPRGNPMRRFASLVLVLCLASHIAAAVERRDGNWWIPLSENLKLAYITGFFDGTHLGRAFSAHDFTNTTTRLAIEASFDKNADKYLGNVTNDQLVDGLNDFYKDFRNRRIRVNDATWVVVNDISGTPKEQLAAIIDALRRDPK
jgi:hypothetical protein